MISYIFRSVKKDEMYLYLLQKDGFDSLNDQLRSVFGKPEFVMMINLDKRAKLARVDINHVKEQLSENGYFLQMPPTPEKLEFD